MKNLGVQSNITMFFFNNKGESVKSAETIQQIGGDWPSITATIPEEFEVCSVSVAMHLSDGSGTIQSGLWPQWSI